MTETEFQLKRPHTQMARLVRTVTTTTRQTKQRVPPCGSQNAKNPSEQAMNIEAAKFDLRWGFKQP